MVSVVVAFVAGDIRGRGLGEKEWGGELVRKLVGKMQKHQLL